MLHAAVNSAPLRAMASGTEARNIKLNLSQAGRARSKAADGRKAPRKSALKASQSSSSTLETSPTSTSISSTRGFRDWPSPLPPTASRPTRCERYSERLWGLTQPFTPSPLSSFSAENRMSVYALPARWRRSEEDEERGSNELVIDLFLHNPIPPTDELVAHLEGIKGTLRAEAEAAETERRRGESDSTSSSSSPPSFSVVVRVAHLVVPSSSPEHWSATADALERLGEKEKDENEDENDENDDDNSCSTLLWVPPNFFEGGGRLLGSVIEGKDRIQALKPRARLLEKGDAQEVFGRDVSVTSVVGGGLGLFTEVVFHLRSARAVLTADSAFCLSQEDAAASVAGPLDLFLARVVGIYGKLGSPVGVALKSAPGGQGREFAKDVLRWCENDNVEMVVSCHLSAPVRDDAAGQLRRVFGFLL